MLKQAEKTGDISIVQILRTIVDRFWFILFRFLPFFVLVYFGLHLFVVPGALIFVVLLFLPQGILLDLKNWRRGARTAWDLGFKYLGKCLMIFVSVLGILKLVQDGSAFLITLYAQGHPIGLLLPPILGTLLYPLYSVFITYLYLNWKEDLRSSSSWQAEAKTSKEYVIR